MNKPTGADTYLTFITSGFDTYSWWVSVDEHPNDSSVHAGWAATVKIEDPDADVVLTFVVDHAAILRALRKIRVGEGGQFASPACKAEVKVWTFTGPDHADFDAATADEVLQVANIGDVAYG